MANISDLSGDERAQRIAELKKKMQEAAAARATESADAEGAATDANAAPQEPAAKPEPTQAETAAAVASSAAATDVAVTEAEPVAVAEPAAETEAVAAEPVVAEPVEDVAPAVVAAPATNGTNGASAPEPLIYEKSEEEKAKAEMNRREFITYAWGAAMGLLTLEALGVTYFFMYPRFREGEFGGVFRMGPETSLPPADAAPQPMTDGKFWWVNITDEGPKAIYMVCTHLGCLYKWVGERNRFECPCHGSKFTREGFYIEGPAPRSLDSFETALVDGEWLVDTGAKILGSPASDSPAKGTG